MRSASLGLIWSSSGSWCCAACRSCSRLLVGVFVGVGLPHMVVGKLIKRRVNAVQRQASPTRIELLVRGLRSGLPITETMGVVADEMPGPVGEEFRCVTDKMKIGRTMEAALQETADRLGTPEFQFFVITLAIQRETGGNLAETLSNLADVLRKRAADEAQDQGDVVGIQGFGLHRRLAAVHRVRPDLVDQPRLHAAISSPTAADRSPASAAWCGWASARSSWPRWSISRSERTQAVMAAASTARRCWRRRHHGGDACSPPSPTFAVLRRDLCRDDGARPDGQARQGAERAARAVEGGHRRLDLASAARTSPTATRWRTRSAASLGSLKMLQDEQVKKAQAKLMQAGIRSKDLAFVVIFAPAGAADRARHARHHRLVYWLDWFPDWGRSRNTASSPARSSSPTRRRTSG